MARTRTVHHRIRRLSRAMGLPGAACLFGLVLVLTLSPAVSAQVIPGSQYISIGYGSVEGDFSIAARLSGQFRSDMGIEVLMGFVPSKGELSDIYSIVHYRYHLWPEKRIVPHLVGGAGAIIVVGSGGREVDFTMSMGGGITAYFTENVACRLDVENYTVFFEDATVNRQSIGAGIVLIF